MLHRPEREMADEAGGGCRDAQAASSYAPLTPVKDESGDWLEALNHDGAAEVPFAASSTCSAATCQPQALCAHHAVSGTECLHTAQVGGAPTTPAAMPPALERRARARARARDEHEHELRFNRCSGDGRTKKSARRATRSADVEAEHKAQAMTVTVEPVAELASPRRTGFTPPPSPPPSPFPPLVPLVSGFLWSTHARPSPSLTLLILAPPSDGITAASDGRRDEHRRDGRHSMAVGTRLSVLVLALVQKRQDFVPNGPRLG
ncbi:hypothetical protein DCS_02144 [Drechmeria coniospora]|uniref:Uncharacterized protein n=1 Tax=Drechmeria coniospora TaxID=98403 RepID=A0A151GV80_DRECN|nr:hypothetical protein DCS_02144 [Drechmeria coniospora]KYK61004.1 hypothetical protein DCS_02144 [Drechmeria coniospora]